MKNKIIHHSPDYISFGGHYIKTLQIKDYPNSGYGGMLRGLWKDKELLDLGVHIRHSKRMAPTKLKWNNSMKWKYKRLYYSIREKEETLGEIARQAEVKAFESLDNFKKQIQTGNRSGKKQFDMWNFITITGTSLEKVNKATEIIINILSDDILIGKGQYEQAESFQSSGWIAASGASEEFYSTNYGRMVDLDAAGVFFPYIMGNNGDPNGFYNGHRVEDGKINWTDVTKDPGNHNGLVHGASGEGKSALLKDTSKDLRYEGFRVFVFDVDGEYKKICEDVGGLYVDHTTENGVYTDPSRIRPETGIEDIDATRCNEAIEGLSRTISMLSRSGDIKKLNAIDKATLRLFDQSGIDISDSKTWDRPHGGIHGWYDCLKQDTSWGARELAEDVWRYFEGPMKNIFLREDNNTDKFSKFDYIAVHIGKGIDEDTDSHTTEVKLDMAFTSVWNQIKLERVRGEKWSAVIDDEIQRSLINPQNAKFKNKVVTTIRKYNGIWLGGLNNPAVLWPKKTEYNQEQALAGEAIWENTRYKIFFWMEKSGIDKLKESGNIPEHIAELIGTLEKTNQYVFRKGMNNYDLLKRILYPAEEELYKTRGLKRVKKGGIQ